MVMLTCAILLVFFLIAALSTIEAKETNITDYPTDLMKIRACVGMAVDISQKDVAENIAEGKQFVAFFKELVRACYPFALLTLSTVTERHCAVHKMGRVLRISGRNHFHL